MRKKGGGGGGGGEKGGRKLQNNDKVRDKSSEQCIDSEHGRKEHMI